MKILFYDMGSYTANDTIYYLKKADYSCKIVYYHFANKYEDDFFQERFRKYLQEKAYDAVFSISFFPLIAMICHEYRLKYISWSYDSPLEIGLQDYFGYDTNYIFLFDRLEVIQYQALGYEQIYHLPLAVNTDRLESLTFIPTQQINTALHSVCANTPPLNHRGLSYAIASQITHLERSFLLEQLGDLFDTRFYCTAQYTFQSKTKCCGPA